MSAHIGKKRGPKPLSAPSPRHDEILALYRSGKTLREVGALCGISMQWAHQVVKRWAPAEMRGPHRGMRRMPRP